MRRVIYKELHSKILKEKIVNMTFLIECAKHDY
jgi:hypothetical protein